MSIPHGYAEWAALFMERVPALLPISWGFSSGIDIDSLAAFVVRACALVADGATLKAELARAARRPGPRSSPADNRLVDPLTDERVRELALITEHHGDPITLNLDEVRALIDEVVVNRRRFFWQGEIARRSVEFTEEVLRALHGAPAIEDPAPPSASCPPVPPPEAIP